MTKFKIKLPNRLWAEMSGGDWAQTEEPDLFKRIGGGTYLTREEAVKVLDGIETAALGMEGVAGGASLDFEEARNLAAARRSAEKLMRELRRFLELD